jgi:hypothetical protein
LNEDNAICSVPPDSWTCPERLYNDGTQCDCGCGFRDPDCADGSLEACDKCNGLGSCSAAACPGVIDPNAIQRCYRPPPPASWTCDEFAYADGYACDCGCGAQDLDCQTPDVAYCENCWCEFGTCPSNLDPADPTACGVPSSLPEAWTCAASAWLDDACDCGCGLPDAACGSDDPRVEWCQSCNGCAGGRCEFIDRDDLGQCKLTLPEAWTCPADTFYDGVCDCGCGAQDADCPTAQKSDCFFCNAPGSCSNLPCNNASSTIKLDDNSGCD